MGPDARVSQLFWGDGGGGGCVVAGKLLCMSCEVSLSITREGQSAREGHLSSSFGGSSGLQLVGWLDRTPKELRSPSSSSRRPPALPFAICRPPLPVPQHTGATLVPVARIPPSLSG